MLRKSPISSALQGRDELALQGRDELALKGRDELAINQLAASEIIIFQNSRSSQNIEAM